MTDLIRGNCGVVLFKTRSSYASFVTAVTKQPFSGGGLWFKTSFFRNPCYIVIAMDWFGLSLPKVSVGPSMTLESLQRDAGIQRLAVRGLKPVVVNGRIDRKASEARELLFRHLISTLEVEPATPEETVADVFGMPMGVSNRKTPIQMVNSVISRMLQSELSPEVSRLGIGKPKITQPLENGEMGRLDLMTLIGTPFFRSNQSPGMGSLLAEQTLLGDIQDLPLMNQSELAIRQSVLNSADKESLFMQRFSQAFMRMLFKDPLFLSTVIEGVNFGKGLEMSGRQIQQQAVKATLDSGADLIATLNQALKQGEISAQEFSRALEYHLNHLRNLGSLFSSDQTLAPLEVNSSRMICLTSTKKTLGIHDELDQILLDLKECAQDMNTGKSPSLNLSRVVDLLEKLTGEKVQIPEGRHGGFLISNSSSYNYSQSKGPAQGEDMVINTNTTLKSLARLNPSDLRELDHQLASIPEASAFVEVRERIATLLRQS